MSEWVLVPCLVKLREEFDAVSPRRDKGADGAVGDSRHSSSSDHTPDEDSDVLRDHDADHKNEVHALDIDSSGPWPGGWTWFDRTIHAIVAREKAEYESPTAVGRLQYVIWNGHINSRSWGWSQWRVYTGSSDDHTNHAHFSARYLTVTESDTRPWGVAVDGSDEVALQTDLISITEDTAREIGNNTKEHDNVSAATLLQLAVIYAARSDDKAAAVRDEITALRSEVAALKSAVGSGGVAADPEAIADALLRRLASLSTPR